MKKQKFQPKPGQVDFTNVRWAPVVNCVLKCKGKLLVVRRSEKLNFYPGYWNGISGFLDDQRSLEEKVLDEVIAETGIKKKHIKKIRLGEIFDQEEPEYKKTWIVHPVLVEVETNEVKLDWEAEKHRWCDHSEIKTLKLLPGFEKVLEKLAKWL